MPLDPFAVVLGHAYIGVVVASAMYGVTVVQTYIYYTNARYDLTILKSVVGSVFVLDTLHQALITHVPWRTFVEAYRHPEVFRTPAWTQNIQILVAAAISALVHLFFAWRIRILSQSVIVPTLIVIFALTHVAFDSYFVACFFMYDALSAVRITKWVYSTSVACSIGADILVAAAMTYFLAARKSGIKRTDSIVNKLIMFAVGNGLLPTILSSFAFVTYLTGDMGISQACCYALAKAYANSLLTSLNTRERLRSSASGARHSAAGSLPVYHLDTSGARDVPLSPLRTSFQLGRPRTRSEHMIEIDVRREIHSVREVKEDEYNEKQPEKW